MSYKVTFTLKVEQGNPTPEEIKQALMRRVSDWSFASDETGEEILIDTVDYWETCKVEKIDNTKTETK